MREPPTAPGFAEAVRRAIDLGGDTDTVAAVTGGLAGAVHGVHDIPERWTGSGSLGISRPEQTDSDVKASCVRLCPSASEGGVEECERSWPSACSGLSRRWCR